MHEISPVLTGKFDQTDYTPVPLNTASAASDTTPPPSGVTAAADTSKTSSVDSRRYTKFDRGAADAGSTTNFTFSDFLDMINPLQHIPVASSVYREATGETINPVSRVAGDMMYGGIFGLASIAVGGVGAVADSMMEAQTGKDMGGYVMASLFGDDAAKVGDQTIQVASAAGAGKNAASVQSPAAQTAVAQASPLPPALGGIQMAAAPQSPAPKSPAADASSQLAALNLPGKGTDKSFPLDRTKLAYGGVMAPVGNIQDQNMAMALSESSHAMRMGNTIYTNRLMNGPHPLPVASPAPADTAGSAVAAATTPATTSTPAPAQPFMSTPTDAMTALTADGKTGPQKTPVPQALMDDMVMLKALNQYNNLATGAPSTGTKLDVTN